ncbi:DUF1853 family protein [Thalassoglobus polymorphus]|uniref:DUF1853 domain-containing protein n=1 Tax=Thalassoglobus polymorphus TaxID=2527994 RepID=A0A517QLU6_9PLAN|nr:DUF1853 family protein [Thalassoglobus polymorphus]QDT32599.1 hypothetical protein Mal48_18460 [Thalassoglobus polymorphus]
MSDRFSRILRDLEWAITSPSLIGPGRGSEIGDLSIPVDLDYVRAFCATEENVLSPFTSNSGSPINSHTDLITARETLNRNIESLKSFRVGRYFESLIEFWLRTLLGYEIIEHQKQLFVDGRTVGEIDFLFRDGKGDVIHLETAVKFYLHFPGSHRSGSHFIGPNSGDHFEKKVKSLFDHQLKIGKQFYSEVVRSEALVKGRIFYHPQSPAPAEFPDRMATNHLSGSWIYEGEVDWIDTFPPESLFMIARKPHWLAEEVAELSCPSLKTSAALQNFSREHFAASRRPLLVSVHRPEEDCYRESSRFFIIQKQWPSQ